MNLRDHKYSKLMEPNFLRKFLLARKLTKTAQNCLICVFVRYNSTFFRIGALVFLIFCMKLRNRNYSKLTESSFLKKFLLVQEWTKNVQNSPVYLFVLYGSIFLRIGSLDFSHILHKVEGP